MNNGRREFLKHVSLGSGAVLLSPMLQRFAAEAAGATSAELPQRFVFVVKSSGIIPSALVPESLVPQLADRSKFISEPLAPHKLPPTLSSLEPYKDQLAIVQGISGRMCRPGHSSWFGAMGVYRTGGEHHPGEILRATADSELARLYPSPFQHVGLALRGKVMSVETEGTLYPGISAVGKDRELPFQASPDIAYEQLFGSAVSNSERAKMRYGMQSDLLAFMSDDIRKLNRELPATEREKMDHYLNAFEELSLRRKKLATMRDRIKQNAPPFGDQFLSKHPSVRQQAHFDLIAAALITGLTNVVTMRLDNISTTYGDLGLDERDVHGIGHGMTCNGKTPTEARDIIRTAHMKLLADLAKKLKAIPEGNGTLLDNTTIIYFSDSGNEHHGDLREWPYIVLGGCGNRLKIAGRYVQLPEPGKPGHRTIGNWWTTLLNAHGNPIKHYGDLDSGLRKEGLPQTGPIEQLL